MWIDRTRPVRLYRIHPDRDHKALRLVYRTGASEYWGVQMTDWEDAPVLTEKNVTRRIAGRTYELRLLGPKLHMVVLRTRKGTYWVTNTVLDSLSNETMIAIAKGLKPSASLKQAAAALSKARRLRRRLRRPGHRRLLRGARP